MMKTLQITRAIMPGLLLCCWMPWALALEHEGWFTESPRAEISPHFSIGDAGEFVATSDARIPSQGQWVKIFPLEGKGFCRFTIQRKTDAIPHARRSAVVKLTFTDDKGGLVQDGDDKARPVYPADLETQGAWTTLRGTYPVPARATRARVELELRWAPGGSIRWRNESFKLVDPPAPRTVRVGAVHFRPRKGKSARDNCEMFAPLIADAARQGAELVVLPECVTLCGRGLKNGYFQTAESIPGPSTEYFGTLAKEHELYLVVGLLERAEALVYNVAVLIGPDGTVAGKYRKVCIPREEIKGGVVPGSEYPVFDLPFGKLGMMVCYDVHFPEVARELGKQGAELIAMPIWGGHPDLAKARAIENQLYLITSTYTEADRDWMRTGVWTPAGELVATTETWGTVVVHEIDLDLRAPWHYVGDFRGRIPRERPVVPAR